MQQKDGWNSLEVINRFAQIKQLNLTSLELYSALHDSKVVDVEMFRENLPRIRVKNFAQAVADRRLEE